jgi:hypothetical protein
LTDPASKLAPIQIEIAECGAAESLIELVKYDEEDDGTITMSIKILDGLAAEGNYTLFIRYDRI